MPRLTIRIIPNASRSEIIGQEGSVWKIRLAAPPVNGKANEALIRFLADKLDCAPSEIRIIKGHASKMKIMEVPMHEKDAQVMLNLAKNS